MDDDSKKQKQIKELKNELANANTIIFNENLDKKKLTAELVDANKELASQDKEIEKGATKLVVADKELALQNKENEELTTELVDTNKELAIQDKENEMLTAELVDANKKIVIQSELIKVQMEKQLLEKTLMCIGDAVIATDIKNKVKLLNKAAETITGWTQKEALGKPIDKVYNIINEVTRDKVKNIITKVITSGQIHQEDIPNLLIMKDSKEILIENTTALIVNEQNKSLGVVIVFRDYTKKWEQLNKIESQSFRDELTGLYNRRFYKEELERMDTKRNLPLSLIMCDVNGLKLINDSFGHSSGDELLKIAAQAITEGCRTDDIAARLGGDEFIIVLPKTNATDAALVIERIKSNYEMKKVNDLEISISFGTGTKVDESQDINDIFIVADKNMYQHKVHESANIKSRTIDIITKTLFKKSKREMSHSKNVSILVEKLAEKMEFSTDNIKLMTLTALMHDIGKIGISDEILNKEAKLDENEYDEIKKHPEIGYRILSSVNEFSGLSNFVLAHHERWDGKGYPRGLKGEEIPIQSRIIALADSYDAMTNELTYKKALIKDEAIEEIKRCSGTQFDPDIAEVFIEQVLKQSDIGKNTLQENLRKTYKNTQ